MDLICAVPGKARNADQKTWPLGMALYVPEAWANDQERRQGCGVPVSGVFRTKNEIALEQVDRARRHGVPHQALVTDAGYGDSRAFRKALRSREEPYVVGVTPSGLRVTAASVPVGEPTLVTGLGRPRGRATHRAGARTDSPKRIAARVEKWGRVERAEGTKGPLTGLFHRERVRVVEQDPQRRYVTDEEAWLLLEKRSNELEAYLCWGLDDAFLENLVELANLRWTIGQFHEEC